MTDNVVFGKCCIDSSVFSINSFNNSFQPRVTSAGVCMLPERQSRGQQKPTKSPVQNKPVTRSPADENLTLWEFRGRRRLIGACARAAACKHCFFLCGVDYTVHTLEPRVGSETWERSETPENTRRRRRRRRKKQRNQMSSVFGQKTTTGSKFSTFK